MSIGRLVAGISSDLFYQSVLPNLGLDCGWEKCTPGKLYLLLTLLQTKPVEKRLSEFLSLNWNSSDLVSQDSLNALSEVLMVSLL